MASLRSYRPTILHDTESGITFDKNGNIKTLLRAGSAVDNLTYSYAGNRLSAISDASGNSSGVKNGASSYAYDANGNMTSDGNRGATLTYNYLNLPKTVVINSKTLSYDYDASGTKHRYTTDTLTIKYAGPFEYNASNNFSRLALSEGQAAFRKDTLRFDYYLKDHLGNVRIVFDEKGKILQQTDYYPFGLEISRDTPASTQAVRNGVNRYLYNEKELQVGTGYIDYGARMYMPEIARWGVVDPLAEKGRCWSPYNYAFSNPMRFIDPDGMRPIPLFDKFKNWTWRVDSWFGKRNTGLPGASTYHRGLDFNYKGGGDTDFGSSILSTHDGTASIDNNTSGGEGRSVVVTSPDGKFRTRYFHLSEINVVDGQTISESTVVGEMGGSANGKERGRQVHLHYEIQKIDDNGNWASIYPTEGKGNEYQYIIDPQKWIKSKQQFSVPTENHHHLDNSMKSDATSVRTIDSIVGDWLRQNPNIKVTYK